MTGHPESSATPSPRLEGDEADSYHSHTDDVLTLQTSNGSSHPSLLKHLQNVNFRNDHHSIESDYTLPVPLPPSATPVRVTNIYHDPHEPTRSSFKDCINVKLEPLEHETTLDMDKHMTQQGKMSNFMLDSRNSTVTSDFISLLPVKDEPTSEGVRVTNIYHDPHEQTRCSFKDCINVKLEPLEHETTLDMDTHINDCINVKLEPLEHETTLDMDTHINDCINVKLEPLEHETTLDMDTHINDCINVKLEPLEHETTLDMDTHINDCINVKLEPLEHETTLDMDTHINDCINVKLEPLEHETTLDMDKHMTQQGKMSNFMLDSRNSTVTSDFISLLPVKDEPTSEGEQQLILSGDDTNDSNSGHMLELTTVLCKASCPAKSWSQQDMENALDALKNHNMSLTKASSMYGIPSTTLWQRAHRQGIETPKKEGPTKSWNHSNLHNALHALRTGAISANKASKAYGIPSSTLYKIARREGIRLAAPFNAAPTAWCPGDLERALDSIRSGQNSVQRASTEFGIPSGTLYGRCKREGIELSRSNPTPWSENAMGEALEAVRVGQMSINQAAIHYNLPYSSLYGRFKRCKYEVDPLAADGALQPTSVQADPIQSTSIQASVNPHIPHSHMAQPATMVAHPNGSNVDSHEHPTSHSPQFNTDGLPLHTFHHYHQHHEHQKLELELPRPLYLYHSQAQSDMSDSIQTS